MSRRLGKDEVWKTVTANKADPHWALALLGMHSKMPATAGCRIQKEWRLTFVVSRHGAIPPSGGSTDQKVGRR